MSNDNTVNPLGMSDEEFLNEPLPVTDNPSEEAADAALEPTDEATATETTEVTEDVPTDSVDDSNSEADSNRGRSSGNRKEASDKSGTAALDSKDKPAADPKSFYERVTASFKANGREMQVSDPEEVVQLMQMGANYAKKMAALKPSLKAVKVLEKHNLLDDEKLGYLIDLHNKNPDAIKKLLQDSNLDPMDFDLHEASTYTPKSYKVNESELAMDEVLETIKETPTYTTTLDIVANKWDDASRQIVATNPHLLSVINEHVSNGVYEKVWAEVERERTFNRLTNMSDVEAYRAAGEKLFGNGETNPSDKKVISRKEQSNNSDRIRKKQAASPTRGKSSGSSDSAFNPLAMSDEEFLKASNSRFV